MGFSLSLPQSVTLPSKNFNKAGVPVETQGSAPYTEYAKLTQRVERCQALTQAGKLAIKAGSLMPDTEKGSTMQIISPILELQREDCYNRETHSNGKLAAFLPGALI